MLEENILRELVNRRASKAKGPAQHFQRVALEAHEGIARRMGIDWAAIRNLVKKEAALFHTSKALELVAERDDERVAGKLARRLGIDLAGLQRDYLKERTPEALKRKMYRDLGVSTKREYEQEVLKRAEALGIDPEKVRQGMAVAPQTPRVRIPARTMRKLLLLNVRSKQTTLETLIGMQVLARHSEQKADEFERHRLNAYRTISRRVLRHWLD